MRKVGEILEVVVKDVTEKREKWKDEGEPEGVEGIDGTAGYTIWEQLGQWMVGEIDNRPGSDYEN